MRVFATLSGMALAALGLAAGPTAYEAPRAGEPVMQAEVRALGDDRYRLSLSLDDDAPVWIFLRSGLTRQSGESWRERSWRILTPGVELSRIGHHEALVAADGGDLPRRIEIGMTPFTGLLNADYQPAISLGAGTTALFSDHFTLRPAPSIAAVQALGTDWTMLPDYEGGHPLVWVEGRDFLLAGTRSARIPIERAAYVIHGDIRAGGTDMLSTYVDPSLPDWLESQLETEIPQILDLYAQRLGPHEEGRPELLVSWGGATPGTVSLGGSVIGSQIVMQIEGEMLLTPTPAAGAQARQFIAHEAAHFWLGNLVNYGRPGDAWTSEGGADLMAIRAAEAVEPRGAPARLRRAERAAWRTCIADGANGPLVDAPERGSQEAFYACGLLFSLVAEKAARANGGDFFSFWTELIAANADDATVSAEDWLAHYRTIGGSIEAQAIMRRIAFTKGASEADLQSLYAYAGMNSPRSPRPAS